MPFSNWLLPVVAAAVGTGVGNAEPDKPATRTAAQDLEVLMLAQKLRAAMASQGVVAPKRKPGGMGSKAGSPNASVVAVNEGVL